MTRNKEFGHDQSFLSMFINKVMTNILGLDIIMLNRNRFRNSENKIYSLFIQ